MSTTRGRLWRRAFAVVIAAVVASGPAVAFANDAPVEYWDLPGISCLDMYVPPGGTLSYEDNGPTFSECEFDTPQGTVLYYWTFWQLGSGSAEYWGVATQEEYVVNNYGVVATQESFGTFYEPDPMLGNTLQYTGSRVDTASPRWGISFINGAEFGGSPDAIAGMSDATAQRIEVLFAAYQESIDPDRIRAQWDSGVVDCEEVWDGANLPPGVEVVTQNRYRDFWDCVVVDEGANPFAPNTAVYLRFGLIAFDCQADPQSLSLYREQYRFQQEEPFGLFEFGQDSFALAVDGERTTLNGVFVDEANCRVFYGWPEVIERSVAAWFGTGNTGAYGNEDSDAGAATTVALPERDPFTAPTTVSVTSLVGAVTAIILVGLLLLLRLFSRPATTVSEAAGDTPGSAKIVGQPLITRVGVVAAAGVVFGLVLAITDPVVRASLSAESLGAGVADFIGLWGVALVVAVAAAVLVVVTHYPNAPLAVTPFAVWAVAVGGAGLAAFLLLDGLLPLVPIVAVAMAVAYFGHRPSDHRKHTAVVWGGVVVSLALLTAVNVDGVATGAPDWLVSLALVLLGVFSASTVVLVAPLGGGPGFGAYRSHPVMWAFVTATAWWIFIIVGDFSWQAATTAATVFLLVSVVSQVRHVGRGRPVARDSDVAPATQ